MTTPLPHDAKIFLKQVRDLGVLCLSFINHKAIIKVCETNPQGVQVREKLLQEVGDMVKNATQRLDNTTQVIKFDHLRPFFSQTAVLFELVLQFIQNAGIVKICDHVDQGKAYRDGLERALIDILTRHSLLFRDTMH